MNKKKEMSKFSKKFKLINMERIQKNNNLIKIKQKKLTQKKFF